MSSEIRSFLAAVAVATLAACASTPARAPAPASSSETTEIDDPRVRHVLERSCSPCHADERHDPWYARLAPYSWSSRGRDALDFSDWQTFDAMRRAAEVALIAAVVEDGSMPLADYTFFNRGAKLTEEEKRQIRAWAADAAISAHAGLGHRGAP